MSRRRRESRLLNTILRATLGPILPVALVIVGSLWSTGCAAFIPDDPGGWGTIEYIGSGDDEIAVVRVGGTRYQMGYWYGRLLGSQISEAGERLMELAEEYDVSRVQMAIITGMMWKDTHFDTAAWREELEGVADGCFKAGFPDVTVRLLKRLMAVPDMSEYGCSLMVSWGEATVGGETYQIRNLDWTLETGIQDFPVIAVYEPEDGYAHAVVGFAGVLGAAVGGMNEYGIALSEIQGHFGDEETLRGIPYPVLLRDILYHDDDLFSALRRIRTAVKTNMYHYAIGAPQATAGPDGSLGYLLFTSASRCDVFGGGVQVTEHPAEDPAPFHDSLLDAVYWSRHNGGGNQGLYDAISDRYGLIDLDATVQIARDVGVDGTLVSIAYGNDALEMAVSFAEGKIPAQEREYVYFELEAGGR